MALTTIPAAGAKLRGSVLSSLITEVRPLSARMTSDQALATSSTTLANVTDLAVACEANATYDLHGVFVYTAGTVEDIKFAFTLPTGATFDTFAIALNSADVFTQLLTVGIASGTAVAYGGAGVGSPRMVFFQATLVMSSTAGNLQVQAAQNTSGGNASTVKIGSKMTLVRTS
ncbi:MAG TPA: hypothetical protein VF163_11250 [Micromonosporaceae bacterium]